MDDPSASFVKLPPLRNEEGSNRMWTRERPGRFETINWYSGDNIHVNIAFALEKYYCLSKLKLRRSTLHVLRSRRLRLGVAGKICSGSIRRGSGCRETEDRLFISSS
jgi:hypothetical protein